jgi:hypothetical protein
MMKNPILTFLRWLQGLLNQPWSVMEKCIFALLVHYVDYGDYVEIENFFPWLKY